jgi:hypothetical protein
MTVPHSPARYRVNGVVVNLPEFAKGLQLQARRADGAGETLPRLVKTQNRNETRDHKEHEGTTNGSERESTTFANTSDQIVSFLVSFVFFVFQRP